MDYIKKFQNEIKTVASSFLLMFLMAMHTDISLLVFIVFCIFALVVYLDRPLFMSWLPLRMTLIVVSSAALLLHQVPGFNNLEIYSNVALTDNAVQYSLYLNFDKLMIGLVLFPYVLLKDTKDKSPLPFRPKVLQSYSTKSIVLLISLLTMASVFILAWLLGLIQWQLKLPHEPFIFFSSMLFITVIAEECLFRGILQRALVNKIGVLGVVLISGVLFGAVHISFSPMFALVSVLAGLGYGFVYYYTRNLLYAIFLHFVLNSIHAVFFTYPMLALD